MAEADACRTNGWGVGTVLEGDEGYGLLGGSVARSLYSNWLVVRLESGY